MGENFELQKLELTRLNFYMPQEGIILGNQHRALAKCRQCRCLVEVPLVYSDGAGGDAKQHHANHKKES